MRIVLSVFSYLLFEADLRRARGGGLPGVGAFPRNKALLFGGYGEDILGARLEIMASRCGMWPEPFHLRWRSRCGSNGLGEGPRDGWNEAGWTTRSWSWRRRILESWVRPRPGSSQPLAGSSQLTEGLENNAAWNRLMFEQTSTFHS